MRQVFITRHGAPEVLQVRESDDPVAGEGQVRIRVKAAGINFADLMARMGLYPEAPKPPCVIGYEVSGELDQLGEGVVGFSLGERVFGMPRFGGYTDCIVLPATNVLKMPAKMTFEQAAALPVVSLTAHHMMLGNGNLRRNSKVLIHSAAGGVGLAAIQIAKTRDCEIIGIASANKHEFLRSLGVQHCVDAAGELVPQVRAIVGDAGVDLVLDPVGGRSWADGFSLLAPAGRLVCFGFSAAVGGEKRSIFRALMAFLRVPKWSPMQLMESNRTVSGTNMLALMDQLDLLIPQFEELIAMFDSGQLDPRVDKAFPFAEAAAAHQYLHDRKAKGKVLLVP